MPYGNIGDASNNNHKQLHHSIGLSDPNTFTDVRTVMVWDSRNWMHLSQWLFTNLTSCITRINITLYSPSLFMIILRVSLFDVIVIVFFLFLWSFLQLHWQTKEIKLKRRQKSVILWNLFVANLELFWMK